jgi:formylglycine-generating enzyme required for sulfatase activity
MSIDYSSRASIGMLKRIPAGAFRMGSRFHPREYPPRLMQVGEFQIAQVPVTVSQYSVFVDSKAVKDKQWWSPEGRDWLTGKADSWGRKDRTQPDAWDAQLKRPFRPVTGVTLFEAEAYCAWVGSVKNQSVRLPTELEWEYAARGEDLRAFPWGDTFIKTFANVVEGEHFSLMDAGALPNDSSPFGLMDMCGNAQQWTTSAYTPYPRELVPPGPLRVARGGSFNDTAFGARTSYRRGYPPGFFFPFLGFRVVVSAV